MLSKITELFNTSIDSLNEQQWFQELKTKWEELDPQSRTYLKFGGVGFAILFVIFFIFSAIWNVHSLKSELREKRSLLNVIQSANDEIRVLKENIPTALANKSSGGLTPKGEKDWAPYFESMAATNGVDKTNYTIGSEKPGISTEQIKESFFDVSMKHVSIKQVIRFAFALENGTRPVKLKNILIDTKEDPTGYLDANMSFSVFTLVEPK